MSPGRKQRKWNKWINGDSPAAIEAWIAYAEALEPVTMSEEEWAAWQERRKEDREWQLAHAEERNARLDKMFE